MTLESKRSANVKWIILLLAQLKLPDQVHVMIAKAAVGGLAAMLSSGRPSCRVCLMRSWSM
jgi:hypothetical protein